MKMNDSWKPVIKSLGIEHLRRHQILPIQSVLNGYDTMVMAATGSGKSNMFCIPALLHRTKLTLVIEPTLSLLYSQVHELQVCGVAADYIDHYRTKKETEAILHKVRKAKLTFLYVTPERLQSEKFQQAIRQTGLYMLVVDECHCVTEWGYSFRESYLQIGTFIDCLPERPVIFACSATILEDREKEIAKLLHMRQPQLFQSDLKRKNLILLKKDVTSEKRSLDGRLADRFQALERCIRKYHGTGSVLIYALTTGCVDAIYNALSERYPGQVSRFHAKMKSDKLRHRMELDFLQGKTKIMVATSAFGMGIDVPNVELIIHFNVPISMTDYIQQIGRAGRNGQKAHCVLFFDQNGDDEKIAIVFQKKAKTDSPMAGKLLKANAQEMRRFAGSEDCMVREILRFQGQQEVKNCKCCTNCAKKRRGE